MAEKSRDCSEIANVPGSSACKSSSSDPNFTMAEEEGHLTRDILGSTSTSDGRTVNVNLGTQGDVVGNVSGNYVKYEHCNVVHNSTDRYGKEISIDLNPQNSTSMKDYVGMESHLKQMLSYLYIGGPDNVRIIGICGMGGIGKTTIAEVVFETEKAKFDCSCSLMDVREVTQNNGVVHLQQKLVSNLLKINVNVENITMGKNIISSSLRNKRVLIILDDVDDVGQLEALCHRKWFGLGSRIIITSRNEHLLREVDGDEVYQVNPLAEADALKLFRMKAFEEDHLEIEEEFLKLSKEFLKYADGLPLVIKVLGSSVKTRKIELWSSTLDRLKNNPTKNVTDSLRVSFEGLEKTEKKIFLDIACFFKGHDIAHVTRILQGDGHCPDIDIEVLREKSLVTLFGRKLWMHDLIQTMGWEIVLHKYPNRPEKRSRLWDIEDIIYVLDRRKATNAIESILLQGPTKDDVIRIKDSFSKMDRLRLLNISNVKFSGNIKYLSNELQYLKWHEYHLDFFPSKFQPDNLVELQMHSSRIKQLWRGKKGWGKLRVIDMTNSQYLISTPDFTEVPSLEILVLEGCKRLVEVHPSLGSLKKLLCLNMRLCMSVESLPPFTSLESLKVLSLSLCSRLKKFPEIEGKMKSLLNLHLDGTSIVELPPSVERLTGLTTLNLTDCKSLLHFPSSIQCLTSLKSLHLAGCSKLDEIHENLKCVESLEQLYIGGTAIRDLSFLVGMKNLKSLSCPECEGDAPRSLFSPASLSSLTSLIDLDLSYCNLMDGDIPDDLSSLISLRVLHLCGNCFVRLPESLSQLSKLETLYLRNCRQLESLPKKLPSSLQKILADGCTSLKDYPNQIKVLTSEESGVTTVDSRIDSSALVDSDSTRSWTLNGDGCFEMCSIHNRHTEEQRVDCFSLPISVQIKDAEKVTLSNPFLFVKAENEIIEWFSTTSTRTPISIKITDYEWKGVAACAVFSVNATTDAEFSNYWYHFILETDVVRLKRHVIDWERDLRPYIYRSSSDLILIKYEPSFQFSKGQLNISTVVRASFETNNPFMVVHKCGIRLVYEKDAGWQRTHILPHSDTICLNTDEDDAVLESGWLSQDRVHKPTLKWEKFIPPSEEDYSTLVLRKNIESVLPRYLEALNHQRIAYKFNLSGSPAWFKYSFGFIDTVRAGSWCHAPIDMPQNLHKSKKWMGFAIHASFAEEVGHVIEEDQEDNYHVYIVLTTTGGKRYMWSEKFKHVRLSEEHHQLFVVYIPRAQILESAMFISYMIDSPHVKFRTSGIRVVYQEDMLGLANTIIQCIQKEDSLEFYDKLVVENWIELIRLQGGHLEGMSNPKERDSRTRRKKEFELHSQKYINWDWSARISFHCTFYRAEVSKWKWFMHVKEGNSAEIQLPPNLFDDANWLGIAVCAFYRLSHEDPNMSVGSTSPDSEYNVLTCRMKSDVDWADLHDLIFQGSVRKPELTEFEHDSTWFYYIPRKCINKFWRECTLARATFLSSRQWIGVHGCALGLVYKEYVKRLVQTLTSCDLP